MSIIYEIIRKIRLKELLYERKIRKKVPKKRENSDEIKIAFTNF